MTRFLTIFQTFSKIVLKERWMFSNIFQPFLKISKEGPMMFGSYNNTSKGLCNHTNGDYFSIYGNTNILTCER